MKKWFTSRLYQKIVISFLLVALVPLCLVYFYINSRYSRKMEQDAVSMNRLAERSAGIQLEDFLTKAEYISNLFFNGNTQNIIKSRDDDALSLYNSRTALEKVVRVSLDLYKIMDYVDQVTFVKKNGICYDVMNSSKSGDPLRLAGLADIPVNSYKNHVLLSGGIHEGVPEDKMVYVRRINDINASDRKLGDLFVVFDRANLDHIFEDLGQVLETRVVIRNLEGQTLYANFSEDNGAGHQWLTWDYQIANFGLNVSFYDEAEKINANILDLSRLTGTVILITIVIILVASLLFARTIVTPVIRLRNNLVSVRSGNFKVRVPVETKDELGDVGEAFNDMAAEIDRLVNQVYTIQLKENETAIAALQAQINPHFLYNTLDMIKSMAEIYGAYEVGDVIVALSGVFRYATHTSSFIVTIQDELDNLQNYMKIVTARFGGKISCAVDVPDELLKEQIVKVCLQPLVENAISHGMGRGGKGREIRVWFRREGRDIVIEVSDDGVGISAQRLSQVRERLALLPGENQDTQTGSVGLKNIHDRIRLYYGGEYGVTIDSVEGQGTAVTVRYPSDVRLEQKKGGTR